MLGLSQKKELSLNLSITDFVKFENKCLFQSNNYIINDKEEVKWGNFVKT